MVTFDDIKFKPHHIGDGVQGKLFFPGGYGISVVRFRFPFGSFTGSYTSDNVEDYEVAILKGDENYWEICYDTHFTTDVLKYQTKEDINKILSHLIRMH
jgi:hypothetical protein